MKLQPPESLPAPEDRLKVALRVVTDADSQVQFAECGFGTDAEDESGAKWGEAYADLPVPNARDAAEFGALASKRWRYYRKQGAVVRNLNALKKAIRDQPNAEVAMLAVMRAPWFAPDNILGVCHFRRTWANSLYVDFLARHPLLETGSDRDVRGVGLNLTAFIVRLARAISATRVWGESAEGAAGFWQKIFRAMRSSDELRLSRNHYGAFLDRELSKGAMLAMDAIQKSVAEKSLPPNLPQP